MATGGCPKRDGFPVILGVVQEKGEGGGGKVHLGQEQGEDAAGQHAEVDPGRKVVVLIFRNKHVDQNLRETVSIVKHKRT